MMCTRVCDSRKISYHCSIIEYVRKGGEGGRKRSSRGEREGAGYGSKCFFAASSSSWSSSVVSEMVEALFFSSAQYSLPPPLLREAVF